MTAPDDLDYRGIFEQSPGSYLVLSPTFVILAASDAYLRDTMTHRGEIVGRVIFDVFPDNPEDPNADGVRNLRRSLRRVLGNRVADTMALQKYDIPRPDGGFDERYWSPVNSPIYGPDGEVELIIHQVMDVTSFIALRDRMGQRADGPSADRTMQMEEEILRRAEEVRQTSALLLQSEERFRVLSSATTDAIWDRDLVADEIWLSEGWSRLLGLPMEELDGLNAVRQRLHPDDHDRVVDAIDGAIAGSGDGWSLEYRLIDTAGRTVWVEGRGTIMRDEHGRAVRMVGGLTDLTARKDAELRIEQQAALLDKASDAIMVRTIDDRLTFWSEGAERMYGWRSGEVLGRDDRSFRQCDLEVFDAAKTFLLEHGTWTGELEHCARDGRHLLVEARWTLLRDDAGRPEGILVINTDITARRKLEEDLMRVQRMDSIGTLAGGIAHDLNNVLTPILLAVELLRKQADPTRAASHLDLVETSARRGADMVQQVLSFARGSQGRRDVLEPCAIVDDVVRLTTESFPKSITISKGDLGTVPPIVGDETQLQQVVLNLCLNARDAMVDGGRLTIDVGCVDIDEQYASMSAEATTGEHIVIEVRDTGCGIPADELPRVFEPFFTTKPTGEGTGLGLATSRAIVKSHRGFMNVYTEVGRGTTFKVYLPTASTSAGAPSNLRPPAMPDSAGGGDTVLLVDDEDGLREITRATLEASGYAVVTARNGAEAISIFEANTDDIDLVLTDVMMPVMDGNELMTAVRSRAPALPIVAVSGLIEERRGDDADGSATFLRKPYTAAMLLETVRSTLDRSRRQASH